MAAHLSLNTVIHAAVRRDLRRFEAALAAFPVGSSDRAGQLARAWDNLDAQLYHHHHGEETIFWPALRRLGAEEHLVGDLGGEHEEMAAAMNAARTAMAALAAVPDEANLQATRQAFAALARSVDTHFAHEERDLEPMMVRAQGTPEMREAQQAIRKTQSLPEAGVYLAWLQDGADADSLAYLRHEIPAPLVTVLSTVFGRTYTRRIASVWA